MPLGEAFPSTLGGAQEGAPWAWAALYEDLAAAVTGYLTSRGAHEPEDLASETFLQVARGIREFTGDERAFRSWVFVIAHRRLQDERRRAARRPVTAEHDIDEILAARAAGGDVETEAIAEISGSEALAMVDGLSTDQRDVLLLRVVAGLSLEETASVVGKKVGAVKSLQRRALIALKSQLASGA